MKLAVHEDEDGKAACCMPNAERQLWQHNGHHQCHGLGCQERDDASHDLHAHVKIFSSSEQRLEVHGEDQRLKTMRWLMLVRDEPAAHRLQ